MLLKKSFTPKWYFCTTKVADGDQGYDSTLKASDASLKKLHMDYVDLYLVHWLLKLNAKIPGWHWKNCTQIKE